VQKGVKECGNVWKCPDRDNRDQYGSTIAKGKLVKNGEKGNGTRSKQILPGDGSQNVSKESGNEHSSKEVPDTPAPARGTLPHPKWHIKSAAEKPELIDDLVDKLLKGNLNLATPEHVLAASPVIRHRISEYLRAHRVENKAANQLWVKEEESLVNTGHFAETDETQEEHVVGVDSLALREVDVTLNHSITESAVLDDGCQIITIREDLWRELGNVSLHTNQ
jgi:hypothetical protein